VSGFYAAFIGYNSNNLKRFILNRKKAKLAIDLNL